MRLREEHSRQHACEEVAVGIRAGFFQVSSGVARIVSIFLFAAFFSGCARERISVAPREITPPSPAPVPESPYEAEPAARVAIIIDDVGHNQRALPDAIALSIPVDFAVLPDLPYTERLAERLSRAGFEIMLHLPMEPVSHAMDSGPGSISAEMSAQEIELTLTAHLEQLPMAAGVNNHMGSKATASRELMQIVLSVLSERGLFFVDSLTTSRSVCRQVAKELDFPIAVRDIFLDNVLTRESIIAQLEKVRRLALKKGEAIAIGHFHPLTLRTLQEIVPSFEEDGIEFVFVSQFIEGQGGRTSAMRRPGQPQRQAPVNAEK